MEAEQAFLFLLGALASLLSAIIAGKWLRIRGSLPDTQPKTVAYKKVAAHSAGWGWVYYGAAPLRIMALLLGCTLLYLWASPKAGKLMVAYSLGLAAAWLLHMTVALVKLRK